jgi:hypothetical protein
LESLLRRLVSAVPARKPQVPHELNVFGGNAALPKVVVHSWPLWEGHARVVVYPGSSPDSDLIIIIEAMRDGKRWGEVWRSDVPQLVKKAG